MYIFHIYVFTYLSIYLFGYLLFLYIDLFGQREVLQVLFYTLTYSARGKSFL